MSARPSKTASSAPKLITPSRSPRSRASTCMRVSPTTSGVVDSSGVTFPPRLDGPLSGCPPLVDVGEGRPSHDHAPLQYDDPRLPRRDVSGAADRTSVLADYGKHHAATEVDDL